MGDKFAAIVIVTAILAVAIGIGVAVSQSRRCDALARAAGYTDYEQKPYMGCIATMPDGTLRRVR